MDCTLTYRGVKKVSGYIITLGCMQTLFVIDRLFVRLEDFINAKKKEIFLIAYKRKIKTDKHECKGNACSIAI